MPRLASLRQPFMLAKKPARSRSARPNGASGLSKSPAMRRRLFSRLKSGHEKPRTGRGCGFKGWSYADGSSTAA